MKVANLFDRGMVVYSHLTGNVVKIDSVKWMKYGTCI